MNTLQTCVTQCAAYLPNQDSHCRHPDPGTRNAPTPRLLAGEFSTARAVALRQTRPVGRHQGEKTPRKLKSEQRFTGKFSRPAPANFAV